MENTIVVILLASLLVLQVVGIYLLLIRKRFKVTNGEVDLEKFLRDLGEDVERGRKGVEKNIKEFTFNIQNHNKESAHLLDTVDKKTDSLVVMLRDDSLKNKEEVESKINTLVDALNNSLSNVGDKADELIENIEAGSIKSKKEIESTISQLSSALQSMLSPMKDDIEAMKDEVAALKKLTLEKDEKLRRYEEGYDQKNIKNFKRDYFAIIKYIETTSDSHETMVKEINEDLVALLEDVGVEKIDIEPGVKYAGNEKIAVIYDTELTTDKEKDDEIVRIVNNGFYIQISNERKKILKPADVIKYKYQVVGDKEINLDTEIQVNDKHDSNNVLKKVDENKIEIVDVENQLNDEKNIEGK